MGSIVRERYNRNSALTRSVITRLQCIEKSKTIITKPYIKTAILDLDLATDVRYPENYSVTLLKYLFL